MQTESLLATSIEIVSEIRDEKSTYVLKNSCPQIWSPLFQIHREFCERFFEFRPHSFWYIFKNCFRRFANIQMSGFFVPTFQHTPVLLLYTKMHVVSIILFWMLITKINVDWLKIFKFFVYFSFDSLESTILYLHNF